MTSYFVTTVDFGKKQHILPSGDIQEGLFELSDLEEALGALKNKGKILAEEARKNGGLDELAKKHIRATLHRTNTGTGLETAADYELTRDGEFVSLRSPIMAYDITRVAAELPFAERLRNFILFPITGSPPVYKYVITKLYERSPRH